MILNFDKTPVDISIFHQASEKYHGCKHAVLFNEQKSCNLFRYLFDTESDMLSVCGSCLANTAKPSIVRKDVRFY
ncbi:hypothetical protein JXC34_02200 [Candidatus Woesearchaeota archaeon]|nr:hypothetical protein [Candidatus Woesearchaeota archaeon]